MVPGRREATDAVYVWHGGRIAVLNAEGLMKQESDSSYWWSLVHARVEQGPGSPNAERLGPYATYEEAATAIERAKHRTEELDAEDGGWGNG